jgi:hypothetical protein
MNLLQPPWFEHQREEIIKMLEPITVPEENMPAAARVGGRKGQAAPGLSEAAAEARGGRRKKTRSTRTCRAAPMRRSLVAISPSRNVNLRETGPSRGETRWAGVLLHGRGKTPHEKIDLAARMHVPQFRWVVPEARAGAGIRIDSWSRSNGISRGSIRRSRRAIRALHDAARTERLAPRSWRLWVSHKGRA